jgi:aspartate 1-decarboxylase
VGVKNFTLNGTSAENCISGDVVVTVTVNSCTGITEQSDAREIGVYPNPFSEQLDFEDFSGSVTLYNELGRKVLECKAETIKIINTTELPTGVYMIQLTNKYGESVYRKLVKQ